MPLYNFKQINAVPNATELVDIVLTRTQRRTPTVVHPGYKINRIRSFYMRKIKFTQQTISERLGTLVTDFPRLNDIHPFYSDLCNILYDKDHYKLALGQINTAKSLIEGMSRDYIRMIKYGDSLYRCKSLKRAALGRMCTVLKSKKAAFVYLEEVRKHMSRLPSLDPNTRTLLMCGCPNVGKSSFMNKITRAQVDVQPYAFTTKSLFVGHCDYRYLRWQVIDTPGILDHSLEERNTIEMQAITALAHLTCSVMFFLDISEQCGYTIEQQCSLFKSIKALFVNKELIVVANKIDVQSWETLDPEKKELITSVTDGYGVTSTDGETTGKCTFMTMSNISEQGVSDVKNKACDLLLASRVQNRMVGNKVESVLNRLRVFEPVKRDGVVRDVCIPPSVLKEREKQQDGLDVDGEGRRKKKSRIGYAPTKHDSPSSTPPESEDDDDEMGTSNIKKTARELMWENGGPGVWAPDYRHQYQLANNEWKYDAIPQILNGKNIADYVDPDIEDKLIRLEQEEDQMLRETEAEAMGNDESDLEEEEEAAVQAIRERKKRVQMMARVNSSNNKPVVPREIRGRRRDGRDEDAALDEDNVRKTMKGYGVDVDLMLENSRGRKRTRSLSRSAARRKNASDDEKDDDEMTDVNVSKGEMKRLEKKKKDDRERSRSKSIARLPTVKEPKDLGLKDEAAKRIAVKLEKMGKKSWEGLSGEGDQRKSVHLVKWMNTGKKRMGTHNKR